MIHSKVPEAEYLTKSACIYHLIGDNAPPAARDRSSLSLAVGFSIQD